MSTAWGAIRTKRAVREFADRPIMQADLDRILEAGRRAHSSKNQQRWAFIVVRERERLRAMSALGPYCGHIAGAAAAVALVTPDPAGPGRPLSIMWDLGGAAAQMMVVGWELGIGSCPATIYEQDAARDLLGYPADMRCEYVLSFGYPADPAILTAPLRPGSRRPQDELVHEKSWDGAGPS
ncbi:MAG TPA: nitroreductase family protein [Candidatus Limnocylindrales bacterium]|jgi:nitroreductase